MEDKLKNIDARSDYNGIAIHSQDYNFYYVIKQTKKGKITKKMVIDLEKSKMQQLYDETPKHPVLFVSISLTLLLFLTIITKNASFFIGGSYFLLWSYKEFMDFIICLSLSHSHPQGRTSLQYHAAEHMVINAYLKYQRIPTMAEIEQSSPLSKNCGSLLTINHIITYLFCSIFFGLLSSCKFIVLYWIIFLTATIFIIMGRKHSWFRFFEYLVIKQPTKKQLRLARQAIAYYHETENLIRELRKNPDFAKYFEEPPKSE